MCSHILLRGNPLTAFPSLCRFGSAISIPELALHLADQAQKFSQESPTRPFGSVAFIFGLGKAGARLTGKTRTSQSPESGRTIGTGQGVSTFAFVDQSETEQGPRGTEPVLYRVDPTGQFFVCRASSAGSKGDEARTWLSSALSPGTDMPSDEATVAQGESPALALAVKCLEEVAVGDGETLEPGDLEIAITSEAGGFRHLREDEVRLYLRQ